MAHVSQADCDAIAAWLDHDRGSASATGLRRNAMHERRRSQRKKCCSSNLTDHPLSSGRQRDQLRVRCRWRVQDAAVQDSAKEVEPLVAAVEPVAELVEVRLQVRGADAMEDVELPALEVGDDDVDPWQQLAGGLRRGLYVWLVTVTGVGQ